MKLKRGVLQAAELVGLEWISGGPLSLAGLRGQVVLTHFWDYAAVNCVRALPYLKVWHGRYADKGLAILGLHSPEFDFGHDPAIVRGAVEELGLPFPVALDASFATWDAWSNRFWPATYLVDREGFLADYQFGEGGYQETEASIQALLREGNPRLLLPKVIEPLRPEDAGESSPRPISPEIYLGYRRGRIGNPEGFARGRVVRYAAPDRRVRDVYFAVGDFVAHPDSMEHHGSEEGSITFAYDATEVHLVAAPGPEPAVLVVEQDGAPLTADNAGEAVELVGGEARVVVPVPRPCPLVRNPECGRHTLTVRTRSPGVHLYCIEFVA
jgi:hypothetical protein